MDYTVEIKVCRRCGKLLEDGNNKTRCLKCLKIENDKKRYREAELYKNNKCRICKKLIENGNYTTYCLTCLQNKKIYIEELCRNRQCRDCAKPIEDNNNTTYCYKCL